MLVYGRVASSHELRFYYGTTAQNFNVKDKKWILQLIGIKKEVKQKIALCKD